MCRKIFFRKEAFFFSIFIVGLIIPMCYTGFLKKPVPGMPPALVFFQNLFSLFPYTQYDCPTFFIQVQLQEQGAWLTLREEDYFQLEPYGYRTRFYQFIHKFFDKKSSSKYLFMEDLALWIERRFIELHKIHPVRIRFLRASYKLQPKPCGHWQNPPLEEAERFTVLYMQDLKSGSQRIQ